MREETFKEWGKNLGEVVLTKRTKLGLSRKKFSEMSGIDVRNLKKIEANEGTDLPKLSTLDKLADAFEMSIIDLVGEMTSE